jgi:hypothetical protein
MLMKYYGDWRFKENKREGTFGRMDVKEVYA